MIGNNIANLYTRNNIQQPNKSNPQYKSASFKGWEYTTEQVITGYEGGIKKPENAIYEDDSVNMYWKDAIANSTDIYMYEENGNMADSISNYDRVSKLLADRAKIMIEQSKKYKSAAIECKEEAINLKGKAIELKNKGELEDSIRELRDIY